MKKVLIAAFLLMGGEAFAESAPCIQHMDSDTIVKMSQTAQTAVRRSGNLWDVSVSSCKLSITQVAGAVIKSTDFYPEGYAEKQQGRFASLVFRPTGIAVVVAHGMKSKPVATNFCMKKGNGGELTDGDCQ